MTARPDDGRYDEDVPLTSWQMRANVQLAAVVVVLLILWHLAVAVTVDGVGLGDWALTARALVRAHPLAIAGQRAGAATITVWIFLDALGVAGIVGALLARVRRRTRNRTRKGFADDAAVAAVLGAARVRASAAFTRPSLGQAERDAIDLDKLGWHLGTTIPGKQDVRLSLEDSAAVVGPSGSGKTSDLLTAAALTAPGALVVTSTRADILDPIAETRGQGNRRIWVFDPLSRSGWPEPMVWNPVAGCQDGEHALSIAEAFVAGLGGSDDVRNAAFFQQAAKSALTRFLHAAALDERTIADVLRWAIHLDDGAEVPQQIIRTSQGGKAEPMWPSFLRSVATGAEETVSSTRQTLQQAIEPLALRAVLASVTPQDAVPTFDPVKFVRSGDTLVLLNDASAGVNVAPLTTMLFQAVVDAAKAEAARRPTGRLDPPLRIVADEVANVAPLPKLPDLSSDARGHGIQLILGLQSLTQATTRWGEVPARTLFTNLAAEIVLGGITDLPTLERYAALVGDVEITEAQLAFTDRGQVTGSHLHRRDKKALRIDEIRMLARHEALLVYRSLPAIHLRTVPWWESPDGPQLKASQDRTRALRLGLVAANSPRNPWLTVDPSTTEPTRRVIHRWAVKAWHRVRPARG